jgi:hypothetical protein
MYFTINGTNEIHLIIKQLKGTSKFIMLLLPGRGLCAKNNNNFFLFLFVVVVVVVDR